MAAVKVSKRIEWPVVVVFREFEDQHEADMEVTAYERNRMYTLTRRQGELTTETTFRFEPVHGGTRVTIEFDPESASVPAVLSSPGWTIVNRASVRLPAGLSTIGPEAVAPNAIKQAVRPGIAGGAAGGGVARRITEA